MKRVLIIVTATALVAAAAVFAWDVADGIYPEIHCKHFFYGYPTGTPATNDLIIRDIYALSSNDTTKFADWVAYRLDCRTVTGLGKHEREWMNDPWLEDNETLEARPESQDDYEGAFGQLDTDRGHQAPLASFKGTIYGAETNYYSNITPQKRLLNRGPWGKIEERVRDLVRSGNIAYVVTGPLYERVMPQLPNCQNEPHRIPSGYWKIIAIQPDENDYNSIRVAAFIFDQDTASDADVLNHLATIDDVESRSGLDFLRELPDADEARIQSDDFHDWAEEYFE